MSSSPTKEGAEPTLAEVMAELQRLRRDLKASQAVLLTVDGVALELVLSPKTVRNQLSAGTFPIKAIRTGGTVRFRRSDLMAYINGLKGE